MKRIALLEFHFDFFIPLVNQFEQNGYKVVLWTSHQQTLQKLPENVFGYRSRFAQIGRKPCGERVSGFPDQEITHALLEKKEMLLNQAHRYPVFIKWNQNELWSHILSMANFWDQFIEEKNINIFLYKTEPHMLFDFILYIVANTRGKTNLFFERLPFDSRVLVCGNLDDMRGEIQKRINSYKLKKDEFTAMEPKAVVGNSNDNVLPFHYKFKRDKSRKDKSQNIKTKVGKIFRFYEWKNIVKGKIEINARSKEFWEVIGADPHAPIKQSWPVYLIGAAYRKIIYGYAYKQALSLCNRFLFRGNFEKGGILFCLQCQPERSSNPCGGPEFYDQIRLIAEISKILGPHKRIYVKEHPSQFSSYQIPEKGRSFKFYYDLLKLENVVLLPSLPTAEVLIENAGCVISLGGSAGWRALKCGVPAIICGQVGYSACEGALPGRNRTELTNSLEKLNNISTPDSKIAAAASEYENKCQKISEQAYLDRIYEQKFDPTFKNALILFQLAEDYLHAMSKKNYCSISKQEKLSH